LGVIVAAVEKICEFSNEYPGGLMWGYKRNHIQIVPKYRKLFRGADATLVIVAIEPVVVWNSGGQSFYDPEDCQWLESRSRYRIVNEYKYELRVSSQALQGQVKGRYLNWTTNLKDTKKRLKRMLRCRNLKVKLRLKS
jgi:hypothetical protein